jgi:four helix bundle protein
MRDHRKQKAHELADELVFLTYKASSYFPKDEMYEITSQMRRCAISVPSNIVEGCARDSEKEYLHFLDIALVLLKELHYQFSIAERLGYLNDFDTKNYDNLINESEKVLGGFNQVL